jgi:hypothetical protein
MSPRHWASKGPGGKPVLAGVKYLSDIEPGEGCTMTEIFVALRAAGHDTLVDKAVLLRNRQESTRTEMEQQIASFKEDGLGDLAEDAEILMYYAVGWMTPLRNRLEERVSRARNTKKSKMPRKRTTNEPIDFSQGDPVLLMVPK